ncbi:hypothetical protein MTBBW1_830067 [Desulfamplus magnetovallimortis]|uniref:Uncharacterized protein n=1 Tax=Desulfamplus magnetovallimortis TaxID=1246637 RepID=A0A1W1HKP8_9BACT|nr:hypothetical protein MTBBW1_830067 [Desulfamplus magnetovallimortis]
MTNSLKYRKHITQLEVRETYPKLDKPEPKRLSDFLAKKGNEACQYCSGKL